MSTYFHDAAADIDNQGMQTILKIVTHKLMDSLYQPRDFVAWLKLFAVYK
jgi:hypothetical protein